MKSKEKYLDSYIFGLIFILCLKTSCVAKEWAPEPPAVWARETTQFGTAKITALDVICGKEHMTVRAEFSAPFQGIIFSKGTYGQENCVYIKPYSSITHATFNVKYDQCGTKPDLQGKYYENTIVIQYGTDIIEAWDEAKRLRCEWFEAYEKPATFRPAIPVADLDVIEMNFQGDEIDCWMSIQEGKGPWAREVSRIVAVGQPMTIVIAINDFKNQFDMRVKSCFAHDGVKPAIHLTDEYGCVLRPKMLSPFKKIRDSKGKATLISYAQFLAFKFPDSMDVQIQCTVEVCRHGCADACQVDDPNQPHNPSLQVSAEVPHHMSDQMSPNHEIAPEDEPQPIYQDIGASHSQHISHKNDENYDINTKNGESSDHLDDPSHLSDADDYQAMPSNQKFQTNNNFENYEHLVQFDSENKPVFKLPELNSNDKNMKFSQTMQIPNLSDLNIANLKPEDFDIANKLLSNHGLNKGNIDFGNLAASFAQGLQHKDIMSIMKSNNMKDLVSKFANRVEEHPIPEALQSDDQNVFKSENISQILLTTTEQSLIDSYNTDPTQPTHFTTYQTSASVNSESAPNAPVGRPQHNRLPFNVYSNGFDNFKQNIHMNKKFAINSKEQMPGVSPIPSPVAQVLDVPLQPGLPFLQVFPNDIIKHQVMSAQKPLQQNFHTMYPNFPKHHFPLPSHPFPPLHPNNHQLFKNLMEKRNGLAPDMVKPNGPVGQKPHIPFGPRSLRIRRSVDPTANEIGVKKGFQVVTSVDLAFFPNISTDTAPIYSGRRDDIIYGVCMPSVHLYLGISFIVWLIVVALSSSALMIYKLNKYKKSTNFKN